MSDANSPRRPKPPPAGQRITRFEARQGPPPAPPRPLAKELDVVDGFPDLRPRTLQGGRQAVGSRPPLPPRVAGGPLAAPPEVRSPLAESAAEFDRASLLSARQAPSRPFVAAPVGRRSLGEIVVGSPVLVLLLGGVFLAIFLLLSAPSKVVTSRYYRVAGATTSSPGGFVQTLMNFVAPASSNEIQDAPGEHSVLGPPTISAQDVETVLRQYNSPAIGTGRAWIALGQQYGIDPAYALAFFIHESTAGANPGWAGLKPGGGSNHNVGNIICAGYASCYGRFRDYKTWDEGIEDWYKLISNEYVTGRGARTVERIIPIYAPAFENDVDAYISAVITMVEGWRRDGVGR